jgi:outer membrane protein assembly factor BamE (lipoprotein component of BamABCDE complex)
MEMFFKPLDRRRWRLAAPLCAALALAACDIAVDQRGNLPDEASLAQIKPGETDKATVTHLIGSPSSVAAFDPNVWYYISQKTKTVAFFRTDVLDQAVVAITFDQDGVVKTINTRGMQDAQAVTPNPNVTPTNGREFSTIEMFLGNFGKFVDKNRANGGSDSDSDSGNGK